MRYFAFSLIWLVALLVAGFFYCYTPVPPKKLATFYDKHQAGLAELVDYANAAIDDSASFYIHLYPNGDIELQVMAKDDTNRIYSGDQGADSVMRRVGLTQKEYDGICQRLRSLGCIGIRVDKGRRTNSIVYKYGGYFDDDLFGFILYSTPMTAEERADALSNKFHIPYSDRVVFWGQFWGKEKARWLRKHQLR